MVGSILYLFPFFSLNRLNPRNTKFVNINYTYSKNANLCFTKELAKRLQGTYVTANCLHPGLIDTGIWIEGFPRLKTMFSYVGKLIFKTGKSGCETIVYLSSSAEVETVNGEFFQNCKKSKVWWNANDANRNKRLWDLSEKLVKLKSDDPKILSRKKNLMIDEL